VFLRNEVGGEPSIYSTWPALKQLRRRALSPLFRISDTGLLGLTALRTHILICGFPRSGTTMLQMMLENGLPQARRFGREVGGWRAATYAWRNHPLMISKVPHDVFRLDPLRQFYAARSAALKIILMVRDPRDVLTSQRREGGPEGYCVSPERWRRYYRAVVRESRSRDVLMMAYEDLISDPISEQGRIEQFTGWKLSLPLEGFHTVDRPDFDKQTLNGLRPIESSLIGRWRSPEHRQRIEQVSNELPELPEALLRLGYATDAKAAPAWAPRGTGVPPVLAAAD